MKPLLNAVYMEAVEAARQENAGVFWLKLEETDGAGAIDFLMLSFDLREWFAEFYYEL